MRLPLKLTLPALGGLILEAEIELPDDLLPATQPAKLTNADLRSRWRCSDRTLSRLRNTGKLKFEKPSPRRYLYNLHDVEQLEKESRRGGLRAVPRRAAP